MNREEVEDKLRRGGITIEQAREALGLPAVPDAYMKQDGGKASQPELLDPGFMLGVGEVLKYGAAKYAPNRWREGMAWSRVYGALLRHMLAWWGGEDIDAETGLSHLLHAGCCLMFLSAYAADERRYCQHDDRPES